MLLKMKAKNIDVIFSFIFVIMPDDTRHLKNRTAMFGSAAASPPTPPASRRFRDRHRYGPTLLVLRNGLLLS
jgi:hypothetical protein